MTKNTILRELDVIVTLLLKYGDLSRASWIMKSKELFSKNRVQFWTGVNSLEWWGGSGSMADVNLYNPNSAILETEQRDDNRRYRAALIAIYEEMVENGQENKRGEMWIDTFKKWQKQGI
jgi:hypothetical protein